MIKDLAETFSLEYCIPPWKAHQHIIKHNNWQDFNRFLENINVDDFKVYHLEDGISWGLEFTTESEMKYRLIYE